MSLLGIALLSSLIVFALSVFYFANRVEGEAWRGRQSEAARNAAGTVSGFIQRVNDVLFLISAVEPDHFVSNSDELENLLRQNPALIEIIRTDPDGRIFASAYRDKSVLASLITIPQSEWFIQARAGNTFIGNVQLSADNRPYLIMAVPGSDGGVVAARVQMDILWDVVRNIHFGEAGRAYVIARNGQIIAHTNPDVVITRTTIWKRPEFKAMLNAPDNEWFGTFTNFEGKTVVGSTKAIDGTEWVVITEIPLAEAFSATRSAILVLGTEAFLLMMVVSLIVARYVRSMIVVPMEQLRMGAELFGQGDLEYRIGLSRRDEIGQLATAFDNMADRLEGREKQFAEQAVALKVSELRYRAIVEDQTELICRFLPDGTLTFVNEAYCRYFGKHRQELIGHSFMPLILDEDRSHVETQFASLDFSNPVATYEHRVLLPDGSMRWQRWTDRALYDEYGNLQEYASVGRDITDRKMAQLALQASESNLRILNAELEERVQARTADLMNEIAKRERIAEALRDSEARYRMVLQQSLEAIYILDVDTLRVIEANPAFLTLLGYKAEEITNLTLYDIVATDMTSVNQFLQNILESEGIILGERPWRRKDGTTVEVEVTANKIHRGGQNLVFVVARDITERKRTEMALRESEERYAIAVRGANDGLWDWNLRTDEIYFSPRWSSMLGLDENEIGNKPDAWFNRVHPQDLPQLKADINLHLNGETTHFECEYRIQHANEDYLWVLSRGLAVRDADGRAHRMAGSHTDITDRKRAEERLAHDALHDALTGLPNRVLFIDRLEQRLEQSKRRKDDLFAVLFIDLDRFKIINDSLGHAVGDLFLGSTAKQLQSCLRPEDTISRMGGDEFAILLNEIHEVSDAIRVAERIQSRMKGTTLLGLVNRSSTASIGITIFNGNYSDSQAMLRDADSAMYRAKGQGGGRYQVFDTKMYEDALVLLQLEADLKRAIEDQEWQVYYQPIVSLGSDRISGLEALIRWNHPRLGIIPPGEFITTAEETGLIVPIGEYVLRESCARVKAWRQNGHSDLWVSVNLSGRQFQDQHLTQKIEQILKETGLPSDGLRLELTESVAMKDLEHSIKVLKELEKMGIRTSLDDFGIGYSSLGYLKRLPFKVLKIDRSFIHDIDNNRSSEAITSAIISLGHILNLEVVAEGVETEEQLSLLKARSCDEVQGYLLSRPMPEKQIDEILRNREN